MTKTIDRKSLMRRSLEHEQSSVDKRFAAADQAMSLRPEGLAGKGTPPADESRSPLTTDLSDTTPGHTNRELVRVPIAHVHDNPYNSRRVYDPQELKRIKDSIRESGQKVAALAVRHPDKPGHVILIDGHYRKQALISVGQTDIDCELTQAVDELDMYSQSYHLNDKRSAQTTIDNALAWQDLLEKGVVADGEGISKLLKISPAEVTKTLAVTRLPQAAIAKMTKHPTKFGLVMSYELSRCAKYLKEQELIAIMGDIIVDQISTRKLESIRSKLEEGKSRKRRELSRHHKLVADGQQIGTLKEWDSGKVVLEINLLDPAARESLVTDLKHRFS
jgi:ParB family chromosome partitioning protein